MHPIRDIDKADFLVGHAAPSNAVAFSFGAADPSKVKKPKHPIETADQMLTLQCVVAMNAANTKKKFAAAGTDTDTVVIFPDGFAPPGGATGRS